MSEATDSIRSLINPNIIIDYETPELDKLDYKFVSDINEININDKILKIAIGHPIFKKGPSKPSILFYNIYYINNDEHTKIGIYEVEYNNDNVQNLYKDFEKVDIEQLGKPLFFTKKVKDVLPNMYIDTLTPIDKVNNELDEYNKEFKLREKYTTVDEDDSLKDMTEDIIPDDTEEEINLLPRKDEEASESDETSEEDFQNKEEDDVEDDDEDEDEDDDEDDDEEEELLPEETFNDFTFNQENYVKHKDDNWIQKVMKNKNYKIIDNGEEGSSLFEAVRKGLNNEDIQLRDMRQIISDNLTEKELEKYRTIYGELRDSENDLKEKINIMSKRGEPTDDIILQLEDNNEKNNKIAMLKKTLTMKEKFLERYAFMEKVNTIEDLKNIALTEEYWGDNIALSLLETLLDGDKVKIIILLEERQKENELNKIVNCNNYNRMDMYAQNGKRPTYYIILSLNETRYKLVTYKDKSSLRFSELPYGIKRRLIDNCTNVE